MHVQRGTTPTVMLRGACLLVLCLACEGREHLEATHVPVPESARGVYMRAADAAGAVERIDVQRDSFGDGASGALGGRALVIGTGVELPTAYSAQELAVGEIGHGLDWEAVAHCPGTARFDTRQHTWTIAITGGADCERWNGQYRPESAARRAPPPTPVPPADPVQAAIDAPREVQLVLPPTTTPFGAAAAAFATARPADARCAVSLTPPLRGLASGEFRDPTHVGNFRVELVESGSPIPASPDLDAPYLAVYVHTARTFGAIQRLQHTFDPGMSRGRVFLVDTARMALVCVGDIEAQSFDEVIMPTEPGPPAVAMLMGRLLRAEETAIAHDLHALAPVE